jgi:hypothetical protein
MSIRPIDNSCPCCGAKISVTSKHEFQKGSSPYESVCDNCWTKTFLHFPDKLIGDDGFSYPSDGRQPSVEIKLWHWDLPNKTLNVLLVEPNFYTRYPPLGLLKISTYHKQRGDSVELIRVPERPTVAPDLIYVTSLFTYSWKAVHEAVAYCKLLFPSTPVILGGIYASLLPDHAMLSGADYISVGISKNLDQLVPDYALVSRWKWESNIVFSSRGCIRPCAFCAIPKVEGKIDGRKTIIDIIDTQLKKIIFWDNNFLASPHRDEIFTELCKLRFEVDFNQALDARLMTPEIAECISSLKTRLIRLACDNSLQKDAIQQAILLLSKCGVSPRKILVYTLFNYTDSPDDFLDRTRFLLKNGVVVYPMRYEPLSVLQKNEFVSSTWNKNFLDLVQQARRVIGYAGSFPPYKPLIEKLCFTNNFEYAFALRPSLDHIKSKLFLSDEDAKRIYAFYKSNNLTTKQMPLEKALNALRDGDMQVVRPIVQQSKKRQKRLSGSLDWR